MGRETKGKRFLLKIQAADSARRIKCPHVAPARFRSSPRFGGLSLHAWSAARCQGNLTSETVAPFRREKIHRRTQDRHAPARCVQKVAQDQLARPAIRAIVRSQAKCRGLIDCFNRLLGRLAPYSRGEDQGEGVNVIASTGLKLSLTFPLSLAKGEATRMAPLTISEATTCPYWR